MRQKYVGSDHQVVVGSFPKEGALDADHTGSVLGFRMVHDIEDWRTVRGGSPKYSASAAGNKDNLPFGPSAVNTAVGFRLVAVWCSP